MPAPAPKPTPKPFFRRPAMIGAAAALMVVAVMLSCRQNQQSPAGGGNRSAVQQRQAASSALIRSVTNQLRDLPAAIALQLKPPSVVLDATSSIDGRDVMATVTQSPNTPLPLYNYLKVTSGNAGFQSLGIQPGDTIKYYAQWDKQTQQRVQVTGEFDASTATRVSMDLTVASILDQNTLTIQGGLSAEAMEPFRMEIWRNRDDRMIAINNALVRYKLYADPKLGWEPSADSEAIGRLVERLNQWVRSVEGPEDWSPAKLLGSLDESLLTSKTLSPYLSPTALQTQRFADHEGRWIQEAIWRRDVARWAGGGIVEPLERAQRIFDWTVRNAVLSYDPRVLANRPWQTMMHGRGTAAQRAWLFASLCQQQNLTVVVLEVPTSGQDESPWLWCGLLVEGDLYLFDPQLGLEIQGSRSEFPATLAEVQAEDSWLRAMDLEGAPYPVTSESAAQAVACVVADSFSLSWRAAELQLQFTAEDALTLFVDADDIADELRQAKSVQEVRLWDEPLQLLRRSLRRGESTRNEAARDFEPLAWRPRLWKARVLHLRGVLESQEEARRRNDPLYDPVNDHRDAGQLYMNRGVRIPENQLKGIASEKRWIYQRAKAEATYWLGILQFEEGSYRSSDNWLRKVIPENPDPKTLADRRRRHDAGVRYNRARALEALGEREAAAELLEGSQSPQRHGDLLRARGLREAIAEVADADSAPEED